MRYLALATDYDGTLAHHGRVEDATWDAVRRLRDSGRQAILVTGRELDELHTVCPHLDLFHLVVAENGALLYDPSRHKTESLAPPPPPEFVAALRRRGVEPLSVGRTIVATHEPHDQTALEVIRELRLDWHVILNKGSVMVLPAGVSKASGLSAALAALGLSPHSVVGVGDAENDSAFLELCGCAAAVANALPALRDRVDFVTPAGHGAGVVQLIEELLADDLARRAGQS
jgi:hydroxymethylpyrimidine pyrophosphatase-like HAD family hydrolase